MEFQIKHECRGRIRVQAVQQRMTLEQADMLETWLLTLPQVECTSVHKRTRYTVIEYQGNRKDLLGILAGFSYQDHALAGLVPVHSSRTLNCAYEERLVGVVALKAIRPLFSPAPLRAAYTAIRSAPYLFRALQCLLRGQLRVELLDGISACLSMIRRDFDTASSVMLLLRLSELLKEWTHKKFMESLARSMSLNIDRVWMKTESGEELAPLHQVRAGDQVVIRMGGMILLDGTIAEGEVMLNRASLTGESTPVPKRPESSVYIRAVVGESEYVLTVTQQSGKGRYDKIVAMIEESGQLKSTAENRTTRLADRLVPYTLAGSMPVYLLTHNVIRALSVPMVNFSRTLKLSMSLAILSAMSEASHFRVTVKSGEYLEAVTQADTIVFDKTDTLTHASPVVAQVIPFDGNKGLEMLRLATCPGEHFPRSMANAVVQAAREWGLAHEEMHSRVEYLVAHDIASTVDGRRVVVDSARFVFEGEGCTIPPGEQAAFDTLPKQYSHLYLAVSGVLAAVIYISGPLRAKAAGAIVALYSLGMGKIVIFTSDSGHTAAAIAAQVRMDEYRAEVLPEDEARSVQAERSQGRTVVMISGGINDSPAPSAANVGIVISDGTAITREIADIAITTNDLFELVQLWRLSVALVSRIQPNYRFVTGLNGGLVALGALGVLAPATSATLHNLSTLGISLCSTTGLLPLTKT